MRRSMMLVTLACLGVIGSARAQDWEAQSSGSAEVLNGVWFTDAQRGVAVGDAGTVLDTEDGGLTWSPLLLTVDDMLDVAFRDAAVGLIVGDNGTIFHTTNGGGDWFQVVSGTESNLAGVAFGAGGLAYAAGRDGVILRSADSGASWSVAETGTDRYRAVSARGLRAWAVGNDGVMRATDDGGSSWFSLPSGTTSDLHDVVFVSTTEGWMVGQNNLVAHTNDGGATWTMRNASIGVGMNSIYFGNTFLGWTGGRLGNSFHSTDGALVWDNEPTPTADELNGIHFPDASHGWSVGENGTILTRVVPSVGMTVARDTIEWDAYPDAPTYGLVRGDLQTLRSTPGNFTLATEECLAGATTATMLAYTTEPTLTGEGFWFLVRVNAGGEIGTYDSGSFKQSGLRDPGISLSGFDCP